MLNRAAAAFALEIERRKLTHEEVEDLLGLAKRSGQVTRFVGSERKPGRELAFKIEHEFGVPMSWWEMPVEPQRRKAG
jgi:transcriptional regulator with XRE-family HTH domain